MQHVAPLASVTLIMPLIQNTVIILSNKVNQIFTIPLII